MCGLCGWIDRNKNMEDNLKIIESMAEKLNNRGPDTSGQYINNHTALMHKRLIIIDPFNGDQPMRLSFRGEDYYIIYNGELYNTEDIRKDLLALGHTFKGHSDTEVILHSYSEWGNDCVIRFNGIYAFAIWKEKAKCLFAARDRVGVKPLFYYLYKDGLIFASEVKSILANPIVKPILDQDGLKEIFLLGPGKINGSGLLKNIFELKPGEYMVYQNNQLNIRSYWSLFATLHTENLEQTIDHTRELVKDSIIRQLVSDVPLACFLSGGLDSSIISKVSADYYQLYDKKLTTYCVDYEDNDIYFIKNSFQPDLDNKYVKIMTDYINSDHTDIVLNNMDLAYALDDATIAREVPGMADIDSSLLLFCKEIKKRNKVCISGECADEIFGGYPWYHKEEVLYRETFPWSYSLELRKKLIKPDLLSGDLDEFVKYQYDKTISETDYLDTDSKLDRRIREMFQLNMKWFMQTLLIRSDRMSSFNGLEVRVPYCDHRLVEYAYNMPWQYKSLYGREKGILREAFKNLLPYEITNRKKSPYPKTFNPIYLDYVREKVKTIINDKSNMVNELINKNFVQEIIDGKCMLSEPWYGQLMRLPQIFAYIIQLDFFLKDNKIELEI